MLDPKKVHMMTGIASYEQKDGKKDIHVYHYSKRVYLSKQAIETFFLVSLGFLFLAILYMMSFYSDIVRYGFTFAFKEKLEPIAILYGIVVVVSFIISDYRSRKRYDLMMENIAKYDMKLQRLEQYMHQQEEEREQRKATVTLEHLNETE